MILQLLECLRRMRGYSLDSRRLLAASEAGVPIKVVPATPVEVAKEGWKMTTPNNGSIICVRGVCK